VMLTTVDWPGKHNQLNSTLLRGKGGNFKLGLNIFVRDCRLNFFFPYAESRAIIFLRIGAVRVLSAFIPFIRFYFGALSNSDLKKRTLDFGKDCRYRHFVPCKIGKREVGKLLTVKWRRVHCVHLSKYTVYHALNKEFVTRFCQISFPKGCSCFVPENCFTTSTSRDKTRRAPNNTLQIRQY